jgi:hypothetical protein
MVRSIGSLSKNHDTELILATPPHSMDVHETHETPGLVQCGCSLRCGLDRSLAGDALVAWSMVAAPSRFFLEDLRSDEDLCLKICG